MLLVSSGVLGIFFRMLSREAHNWPVVDCILSGCLQLDVPGLGPAVHRTGACRAGHRLFQVVSRLRMLCAGMRGQEAVAAFTKFMFRYEKQRRWASTVTTVASLTSLAALTLALYLAKHDGAHRWQYNVF